MLGLDGIPWRLVERWAADGSLPNFARLVDEGAAGPLESTMPPTTPLAWPSIATGTWADKHGVYDFQKLSSDYTKEMYTSDDVRTPTLWEILSPAQVGNVPVTYPPVGLDGRMVTGMTTPSRETSFAHPPEFRETVLERFPDYRFGLQWGQYRGRREEFLSDLSDLVDDREGLMELLMEGDWRLFFFVYTAPDRLQHLIWEEDVILEHYQRLDGILGRVMEYVADRDAALFVVSDHGFGPISKFVYVNRVLEEHGYLVRAGGSGVRGVLGNLGISKDRVLGTLERLDISDGDLTKYLPGSVVDTVAAQVPGDHALYDVAHEETTAFFLGPGNLYVNDTERFDRGIVDPDDVPRVKAELFEILSNLRDPETGEVAVEVVDGDELFPGDEDSPDLVVEGHHGYGTTQSLTENAFEPVGDRVDASHRKQGIFLAWGDAIAPGSAPESATVVDVAPTLLHCLGEPVGESMDGRVLDEIFDPAADPARRPVTTRLYAGVDEGTGTSVDEDYDDVEDRLRGLGYLE